MSLISDLLIGNQNFSIGTTAFILNVSNLLRPLEMKLFKKISHVFLTFYEPSYDIFYFFFVIQMCHKRNVKDFEPSYEIFIFFQIQVCQRENVKNFEPSYEIFHFFYDPNVSKDKC